jgi:hypothetical protein
MVIIYLNSSHEGTGQHRTQMKCVLQKIVLLTMTFGGNILVRGV